MPRRVTNDGRERSPRFEPGLSRREVVAAAAVAAAYGLRVPAVGQTSERRALLGFVGDLLSDRDEPMEAYEPVRELLAAPDLLFGNLEGPYTDHPQPIPSAPAAVVAEAHNLDVFAPVGFDVLSLANNHILDAGHEAMLETKRRLNEQGVATCGAGASLSEARSPAVLETNGTRVAYLAYASVFPKGFEAFGSEPGLAPLRAHNFYRDQIDDYYTPGGDPRVSTVPDEQDHANLRADIESAAERADLVVTSFHWGDHFKAFHLSDHEPRTARFCIDHGADIVVGHHQHVLRGLEWYEGKPIFYGLGHWVFDIRLDKWPQDMVAQLPVLDDTSDYYGVAPRKGWPLMPLHRDARMTAFGFVEIEGGETTGLGFVPCRLTPDGAVHVADPESEEGREVVDYVRKGCETQNLNARIETDGYVELGGARGVRVLPLR